jgi:hypothetical protein
MSVKLIEYWNLQPQVEEKYAKFLIKEWIPGMNKLGLTVLAVWNVLVGAGPQFIAECIADDLEQVERALRDERHSNLNEGLFQWVEAYKSRVTVPTGLIEPLIGEPKHEAVKFNQRWDVLTGEKEAFGAFLTAEFVPTLEKMGLIIGGHWKTLVGPTPHQILEGRAGSLEEVCKVLENPTFVKLKKKLRNYVTHYESRILRLQVLRIIGRTGASYDYL